MKDFQAASDFLTTDSEFPEMGFSRWRETQNSDARRKVREMEKLGAKVK